MISSLASENKRVFPLQNQQDVGIQHLSTLLKYSTAKTFLFSYLWHFHLKHVSIETTNERTVLYQENKVLCSICMFCEYFLPKRYHFALIMAKTQFKDNQSMITWDRTLNMYRNNELCLLHNQGYLLQIQETNEKNLLIPTNTFICYPKEH